jgi:hypothetical protein
MDGKGRHAGNLIIILSEQIGRGLTGVRLTTES